MLPTPKEEEQISAAQKVYQLHKRQSAEEQESLKASEQHLEDVQEAQKLLQGVAQTIQQEVHKNISEIVSRCLAAVFPQPYEFRIDFERKRGKTEARLVFTRDGNEYDPLRGTGGGVVDVAAFALRLACLVLSKPKPRQLLILDEPFKNVHGEGNRERCAKLLEVLSKEMGVQLIIVTGLEWLKIGEVIEL